MKRKNVYYYSRFFSTILILNCAVICVINDIFEYIIVPQKKKNNKKNPQISMRNQSPIFPYEALRKWIVGSFYKFKMDAWLENKKQSSYIFFLIFF